MKAANNVKIDSDVFTIHQQINLKGFFYHHHLSTMKLLPTHTGWLYGKLGNAKYNLDDKAWLKNKIHTVVLTTLTKGEIVWSLKVGVE